LPAHARATPHALQVVVGCDPLLHSENESRLQVILQIFADAGQVMDDCDALGLKKRRATDSLKLQ